MGQISEKNGSRNDGRPVNTDRPYPNGFSHEILILNLMPNKIETENQFYGLFGKLDSKVELTFLRTATYEPKNTSKSYLDNHYKVISELNLDQYDGFICTGSPVETLPFEAVEYWNELLQIFERIHQHELPGYYICWGAQAVLNYRYGIQKVLFPKKQFGVFDHSLIDSPNPMIEGISKNVQIPVSRYTGVNREDIIANSELDILLDSKEAGLCLIANNRYNEYYNFNHFEYDTHTLEKEYKRDISSGLDMDIPKNYYPKNIPDNIPANCWESNAVKVFNNWIKIINKNHRPSN